MLDEGHSSVFVSDSIFESCTNFVSEWRLGMSGGACFFRVASTHVTRCCGYMCTADYRGQFYEADISTYKVDSHTCTDVCVLMCGKREGRAQDGIGVSEGLVTFERVNCSWTTVIQDGAGIECWDSAVNRISEISVMNCAGDGIACFSTHNLAHVNSNCFMFNIINNTVVQNTTRAALINFIGIWGISNAFFFRNTETRVMYHWQWSPDGDKYIPSLYENSSITLVDCVSDTAMTGELLEVVNHRIETGAVQSHPIRVLFCPYPASAVFTEYALMHRKISRFIYLYTQVFL